MNTDRWLLRMASVGTCSSRSRRQPRAWTDETCVATRSALTRSIYEPYAEHHKRLPSSRRSPPTPTGRGGGKYGGEPGPTAPVTADQIPYPTCHPVFLHVRSTQVDRRKAPRGRMPVGHPLLMLETATGDTLTYGILVNEHFRHRRRPPYSSRSTPLKNWATKPRQFMSSMSRSP